MQPGNQPAAPAGDETQSSEAESGLGNLRGDVSVDALSDLDLLILRGNEADVAAVMQVIEKIEQMAIGASPGIDILFLQNVDSEALAALLNDVYTRLSTLSTGTAASARQTRQVNVVAVGSPNAVLILAPQNTINSVIDLATKLDQPQPPGSEVEVFFLRNAVASQVVTLLEGFYEERPGLGTNIRVIADARTNSVVVNGSPKELAEVTKLIREIDTKQPAATALVKVIQLKSALATDLAQFLNTVIQGVLNPPTTGGVGGVGGIGGAGAAAPIPGGGGAAAGGTQALRAAKAMVLEFLSNDGAAQRMIRSGALTDVRISGDARSNTLTITAPDESMALLVELVAVLDQPTSAVADIKAFPLDRADATVVAELLQSLFPVTQQGQPAVQLSGADGFGSALIPLRVSVEPRTNTVVVVGNPDIIRMVEAIIFTIDKDSSRGRKIEVLRLRNSPVADVATAINQYLQSQREIFQIDPTRYSTTEILEQEVIVTPEPISNNLIVNATPRFMEQILALAKKLDREPPQVVISSLIVEVTLEDTDEFGIELGFQDPVLFNRSVKDQPVTISVTNTSPNGVATTTQQIISQSATPGFLFNNANLGNNVGGNVGQVGKQSLTNFALGRVNNSLGFGGLVLSASSEAVSGLLRALAFHRNVQVLSNPKVMALDNLEAQIQQGQQVPIVNGVTLGTTGLASPQIQQQQSGIILTVTPRIGTDGQIVMQVIVEKSQFDLNNGVPVFTDAANGNVITSPIKNVTNAFTTAKVQDGQTIVIGGLITKSEDVSEAKVPYLGDIPVIGNAFRYDSRVSRRTELLIFLTPRIVHGDADIELIKQVEMERMHFFEDDAEMMFGPIMGVPAEEVLPLGNPGLPGPGVSVPHAQPAPMTLTPQAAAAGKAVPMLRAPTSKLEIEAAPPALPPADAPIPLSPQPSSEIPRLLRQ
ncbi:MAG: secretin N-terminal domain-containing protein [Planctomycetaceae bacterium]